MQKRMLRLFSYSNEECRALCAAFFLQFLKLSKIGGTSWIYGIFY